MSGQHWIDAFFRKRLGGRSFPVEEGEFDAVRALLHQRNSTTTLVRGGGFSKWWLSALLPMAGLLWWAFADKGVEAERRIATTREAVAPSSVEPSANGTNHMVDPRETDPSVTIDGTGSYSDKTSTSMPEPITSPRAVVASVTTKRDDRPELRAGMPTSSIDGRNSAPNSSGLNTVVRGSDAKPSIERSVTLADQGNGSTRTDDRSGSTNGDDDVLSPEQVNGNMDTGSATLLAHLAMNDTEAQSDGSNATEGMDFLSTRNDMDAVAFMEPRWSLAGPAGSPEPISSEVAVFKRIPMGELHAFGAPLFVNGRTSGGERSSSQPGSVVGLEYRVRVKRFSWATGIHYGSYALKADQGATDVTLSFVEVPVLASVRFGMGRFGVLMQGGLSMDLLFNASGRYAMGQDQAGSTFPDEAFRTANWSWSLRPQATYQLAERLSVSAGPLWKAQMAEVAKKGPLDGTKIGSSGISIGISWRLDHSTY